MNVRTYKGGLRPAKHIQQVERPKFVPDRSAPDRELQKARLHDTFAFGAATAAKRHTMRVAAKEGTLEPGAGGSRKGTSRHRDNVNGNGNDNDDDDNDEDGGARPGAGQHEFDRLVREIDERKNHVDTMRASALNARVFFVFFSFLGSWLARLASCLCNV